MACYLDAASIEAENKDSPLFRSTARKTKQLTGNALTRKAICEAGHAASERRRAGGAAVAALVPS